MAHRDEHREELFLSDSPGDAEKVRAVLAQWGVEEASIQRLMREHRADTASERLSKPGPHERRPRKRADA